MTKFTKEQLSTIRAFLEQVWNRAEIPLGEWKLCDPPLTIWLAWQRAAGFYVHDIRAALWWYQYRHKPGSKEWRPTRIIRALIKASERDYVEPERLPVDERALKATPADRKRARKVFIKKHGVAAFYRKVKPILTDRYYGGVKRLFTAPATMETREYVEILASVASK